MSKVVAQNIEWKGEDYFKITAVGTFTPGYKETRFEPGMDSCIEDFAVYIGEIDITSALTDEQKSEIMERLFEEVDFGE
jgi:hypothetical protein